MEIFGAFAVVFYILLFLLGLFLTVLWILLPFYVFKIAKRLEKSAVTLDNVSNNVGFTLHEMKKLNLLLTKATGQN